MRQIKNFSGAQRQAELNFARQRLARSGQLAVQGAMPRQSLDEDRASVSGMQALLAAGGAC